MNGSIERGYSGQSFFYKDYKMLYSDRTEMYARLMASIGTNAIVINNVIVHKGLWETAVKHIYEVIPEFGGFLVKADSEGRPGPFTYGRTHAEGANMLARALAPYGGIVVWRCFVYNCGQDWRDQKTDRARAAYDHFMELDGSFDDNVILQIKKGPRDFPSCTFGEGEGTTVEKVVSGACYGQNLCGIAGVINTGDDENWTGNDLAGANLYGFGRLAMDASLSAEQIAREWTMLSLGSSREVTEVVVPMLCGSWGTYEKYNAPLGIGWMVTPHYHYGPDIDGYEYDRWGTYHRADPHGTGVDRTEKGTGYVTQYNEPWCSLYGDMEKCPEELLLFFHHVPYTYVLKTGKTLIQHIYDTHFEGVQEVEAMQKSWNTLKGKIPDRAFSCVAERFERQLVNAREWRDRVNTYFYRKCGIGDEKGRKIYP